jgi:hypothetical protein
MLDCGVVSTGRESVSMIAAEAGRTIQSGRTPLEMSGAPTWSNLLLSSDWPTQGKLEKLSRCSDRVVYDANNEMVWEKKRIHGESLIENQRSSVGKDEDTCKRNRIILIQFQDSGMLMIDISIVKRRMEGINC